MDLKTEIIEYRDVPGSYIWKRSEMPWTYEDLISMNKLFGYEKYKVRYVV